jgi:HSP20 family protein
MLGLPCGRDDKVSLPCSAAFLFKITLMGIAMKCNQTKNRIATPFGDFQVDVENIFDHLFGDQRPTATTTGRWMPRTNVSESDTSYRLSMELPGVDADAVSVEMHDGVLEISGSRPEVKEVEGVRFLKAEQRTGEFRRKFEFTTLVEADKIEAQFENGLLLIELPKSEKVLPRKINIKVGQ